jgi:hypothetical protein
MGEERKRGTAVGALSRGTWVGKLGLRLATWGLRKSWIAPGRALVQWNRNLEIGPAPEKAWIPSLLAVT